jgi:hypothetical protein
MVISGKYLPAVSSYSANADQGRLQQQSSALERSKDFEQQKSQQTVEYIFRGDFEEDLYSQERVSNRYNQQIDPANKTAIFSYADIQTVTLQGPQKQGRLLDLFI